jgi:hypothetical protein
VDVLKASLETSTHKLADAELVIADLEKKLKEAIFSSEEKDRERKQNV